MKRYIAFYSREYYPTGADDIIGHFHDRQSAETALHVHHAVAQATMYGDAYCPNGAFRRASGEILDCELERVVWTDSQGEIA